MRSKAKTVIPILFIAVCLISFSVGAWNHSEKPIERNESPSGTMVVNFGALAPNTSAVKEFPLSIKGAKGLNKLKKTVKTCGCLNFELSNSPDGSPELLLATATLAAPKVHGDFHHHVYLEYDFPDSSLPHTIKLCGSVGKWLNIPEGAITIACPRGGFAEQTIGMKTLDDWPIDKRSISIKDDPRISITEIAGKDMKSLSVKLSAKVGTNDPIEDVKGDLVVQWEGIEDRITSIPITLKIVPETNVLPTHVFLGNLRSAEAKPSFQMEVSDRLNDPLFLQEECISIDFSSSPSFDMKIKRMKDKYIVEGIIRSECIPADQKATSQVFLEHITIKRKIQHGVVNQYKVPVSWSY
jgi:hypothetical protein